MCARRQAEILHSASVMLRPGGRLVYSTCTFAPEENEASVSAFLRAHPDFSVEEGSAPWFSPGHPDWISDPMPDLEKTFRLMPHRLLGEGHYCAVLRKAGDAPGEELPLEPAAKRPKELDTFCKQTGAALPEGKIILFGQNVYLAPEDLPSLKGLHVLRAGLELGEVLKDRFGPAHAWALWLKELLSCVSFPAESEEIRRYLAGDVLAGDARGWTLVQVGNLSLGWAKGDGRTLKNHYPKALRRCV